MNVTNTTSGVSFDVEISPLDKSNLPTEDMTDYSYVVVLSEDNIISQQQNYGNGGLPDGPIPDFVHRNVVRAIAGKVFGEPISLGLSDPGTVYPIKRHVEMNISSSWLRENLRIKAFIQMSAKATPTKYSTLNAIHSPYIGSLASVSKSVKKSQTALINYPNPFSSETTIHFEVAEQSYTSIIIRGLLGNEVARLVNETLEAGKYSTEFTPSNLPNGIYTFTIESGENRITGKMSIVK
jgi:hypothetical protein